MTGSESNHNSNRSVVNRIRMAATPAEAERLLRIFMDKKLTTKQHTSSEEDELDAKLLKIIEHTTLEEHTQVELIMNLIRSRDEQREREIQHGVYTAVWKHVNPVITVMSDKVYLPIQDALQAAKKETGTYPLSPSNQSTKKGKV